MRARSRCRRARADGRPDASGRSRRRRPTAATRRAVRSRPPGRADRRGRWRSAPGVRRNRGKRIGNDRHHRAKQHGAGSTPGASRSRLAGDVGAVRKADGHHARRDRTCSARSLRRRSPRAPAVRCRRSSRSNTPSASRRKEPRHPALEHLAARAQHPSARQQFGRERHEIVLVAAGAVQHQQRRRARAPRGVMVHDE